MAVIPFCQTFHAQMLQCMVHDLAICIGIGVKKLFMGGSTHGHDFFYGKIKGNLIFLPHHRYLQGGLTEGHLQKILAVQKNTASLRAQCPVNQF